VFLGDATGTGRARIDALARYLQDVATDDAADAGFPDGWIVRRLALRVDAFPRFRETVDLVTWCSGIGASAAERHTVLTAEDRPLATAVALWVFVGPDGRPTRIDRDRFAAFGIPVDRSIVTRLRHPDPPAPGAPGARSVPWPLRAADVDVLRHVNNAVSAAALEEALAAEGLSARPAPWSVELEFRAPMAPDDTPELTWAWSPDGSAGGTATLFGGLHCGGSVRTTFTCSVPGTPGPTNLESAF
jgi:acyl-ACP thioesterase